MILDVAERSWGFRGLLSPRSQGLNKVVFVEVRHLAWQLLALEDRANPCRVTRPCRHSALGCICAGIGKHLFMPSHCCAAHTAYATFRRKTVSANTKKSTLHLGTLLRRLRHGAAVQSGCL